MHFCHRNYHEDLFELRMGYTSVTGTDYYKIRITITIIISKLSRQFLGPILSFIQCVSGVLFMGGQRLELKLIT
jgi:hypothetical protein